MAGLGPGWWRWRPKAGDAERSKEGALILERLSPTGPARSPSRVPRRNGWAAAAVTGRLLAKREAEGGTWTDVAWSRTECGYRAHSQMLESDSRRERAGSAGNLTCETDGCWARQAKEQESSPRTGAREKLESAAGIMR